MMYATCVRQVELVYWFSFWAQNTGEARPLTLFGLKNGPFGETCRQKLGELDERSSEIAGAIGIENRRFLTRALINVSLL
jgi:hypothetical protein